MIMQDELNMDVVLQTKREVEARMKEDILDGIAIGHNAAANLSSDLLKETSQDKGPGRRVDNFVMGIAGTMLIMDTAAKLAVAIAKHLNIDTEELKPVAMRARYARLKAEGKVPA